MKPVIFQDDFQDDFRELKNRDFRSKNGRFPLPRLISKRRVIGKLSCQVTLDKVNRC